MAETWKEVLDAERAKIGRPLNLEEMLELSRRHRMTPPEIQAQRESFARGLRVTGDPRFD